MRGALVDRCDRCGHLLVKMTQAQHAAVEAVYEDMEISGIDFPEGSGKQRSTAAWHQIMVGWYAQYKGWDPEMVPTPDGGVVMIMRQKQSRLTKAQGSELIEFTRAYAISRGVRLREFERKAA